MGTSVLLKDIIKEYSVRNKALKNYPVYSVTNSQGFCTDYFGKEVASKDKSTYKIVPYGYFAYNPSRINVGSIDWQHCEDYVIVSPLYNVFCIDESRIKQEFLLYYFKSEIVSLYISTLAKGSVRMNLSLKTLGDFPIVLPSLDEQERIIDELDLLKKTVDNQRKQLIEFDNLVKSIFHSMFGDLIINKKGWDEKKLGELCAPPKDVVRANKVFKESEKIHYIEIASIDKSQASLTRTTPYIFSEAPSRAQQKVENGDILISLVRPNLRNIAMIEIEDPLLVASSGFCVLRASGSNPHFIKAFVLTDSFTKYLTERAAGASYPAVREDDIRCCSLGVPPLNLQNKFSERIKAIDTQKKLVIRSVIETEILYNSKLDFWFNK